MTRMQESLQMLANARETFTKITGKENWWPGPQAERTVFAQAIALEWADRDKVGAERGKETWVSTCRGRASALQEQMFGQYAVSLPQPGGTYASKGNRRFSAFQFVLDFSIWPTDNAHTTKLIHLTMESEMYSGHSVEAEVHNGNGFAYDFFKVLWCPSPRRIFACCVLGESQRDKLQDSLGVIARTNAAFVGDDDLRVFILPPGRKHWDDTRIGVWENNSRAFAWQKLSVAVE